jgi:hypothetical protein
MIGQEINAYKFMADKVHGSNFNYIFFREVV